MYLNDNHQLTMYRNVDFMPNDNVTFDDIESHLQLFNSHSPIDIGPNRSVDELDINIKIKLDVKDKLQTRPANYWTSQINYCKISKTNNGTSYYYYFVTDVNVLSEGTLELTLQLDTLNSFSQYVNDSNYWSTRTITTRQHKDRFDSNHNIVIDKFDEGFGSLPQYKLSDTTIEQDNLNTKWYLVYESDSADEKTPIKCKVYDAKETLITLKLKRALEFGVNGPTTGVYYWDTRFQGDGYTHTMTINNTAYDDIKWILFDLDNNKVYYGHSESVYDDTGSGIGLNRWNKVYVTTFNPNSRSFIGQKFDNDGYLGWNYTTQYSNNFIWSYEEGKGLYIAGEGMSAKFTPTDTFEGVWTLASIASVDRTSKLINKIVECPYCPLQLEDGLVTNATFQFEGISMYTHQGPLLFNMSSDTSFKSEVNNHLTVIDKITLPTTRTQSDTKDIKYETKLLNSNFSKVKFTYDSFTKELKRELFNEPYGKVGINYYQSLNMSSKLMFYFDCDYQEYDDYEKYLVCSRNNECTIYNSQYLDYIRNGYNYDIKNKALADQKNALAIGTSVIGTGLSMASNMGSLGTFSAVQQGVGIVSNIVNMTISNAQQELALEQKKNEALNTTVGVSGTDDASLLNVYNGNKLHMLKYSINTNLKNSLYEQFYLTGYACNDYGRPTLNTRKNFNYIQATTTIDTLVPVTTRIKSDIISRISQGILIIHKCGDSLGGLFNYENWETSI